MPDSDHMVNFVSHNGTGQESLVRGVWPAWQGAKMLELAEFITLND